MEHTNKHSFAGQFIVAANWKMNKTPMEAIAFVGEIKKSLKLSENRRALFFPSFLSLDVFRRESQDTEILFGAQNCHFEASGAFTGEVSAPMLASVGVKYCLVGHSERRHVFGETDEVIAKKVQALQKSNITPMICIGETEKQKMDGQTLSVVQKQIEESLRLSTGSEVLFAYEPVWAIGTGKVPTTADIAEVHTFIRKQLTRLLGDAGAITPILYGGSVTGQNAKEISGAAEVNGFLIGGASLKPDSYAAIYQS
jgi:triosephosphate isomerase (TIM)